MASRNRGDLITLIDSIETIPCKPSVDGRSVAKAVPNASTSRVASDAHRRTNRERVRPFIEPAPRQGSQPRTVSIPTAERMTRFRTAVGEGSAPITDTSHEPIRPDRFEWTRRTPAGAGRARSSSDEAAARLDRGITAEAAAGLEVDAPMLRPTARASFAAGGSR